MHYVIIGNSTAAIAAVQAIRDVTNEGHITIISKENDYAYSRPLISYFLADKIDESAVFINPIEFYERNNIDLKLGCEVASIDSDNKKVVITDSYEEISYDKLLLACGGEPVIPVIFNMKNNNIFRFHTLSDVRAIKQRIDNRTLKIVIVGGGLIGLKAAESLCIQNQKVTVLEMGDYILNSILDKEAAKIVEKHLVDNGIEIITNNAAVQANTENNEVKSILLKNGQEVDCDIVIMATGVKPFAPLFKNQDVDFSEGIYVDEYMETKISDVFAAGDVCQGLDIITGLNKNIPLLPNAYIQGKIAGNSMAGKYIRNNGVMAFNSIPLLGINIATAGISNHEEYELVVKTDRTSIYKKLLLEDNKLKGFVFVGDISRAGIYRGLIQNAVDITNFKHRLLEDDFGLIDLGKEYLGGVI